MNNENKKNMERNKIKLYGRFIIEGYITTLTGLHIGGSNVGIEIGGVDLSVVRDKLTNKPYIPGSSLKGALRACLERAKGLPLVVIAGENKPREERIEIHICKGKKDLNEEEKKKLHEEYLECSVCNIFGVPAEVPYPAYPGRLIVRDAFLKGPEDLETLETLELPYTEVKTEVVIDRITSKTMPRHIERVPPGAWFKFEMIFNVYQAKDIEFLKDLFNAMRLLEDHYLGGHGSRGSGKIKFGKWKIEEMEEIKETEKKNSEENKKAQGEENKCVEKNKKGLEEPVIIRWKRIEEYWGKDTKSSLPVEKKFLPECWDKEKDLTEWLEGIKKELEGVMEKKEKSNTGVSDDKNLQT